jgi:hypothetical protein
MLIGRRYTLFLNSLSRNEIVEDLKWLLNCCIKFGDPVLEKQMAQSLFAVAVIARQGMVLD